MFKTSGTRYLKKFIKRYKKSPWPIIIDAGSLIIVAIAIVYGFKYFRNIPPPPPINNQISSSSNQENIDPEKSLIKANFSWKNGLIKRSKEEDYLLIHLNNSSGYDIRNLKISFTEYEGLFLLPKSREVNIGAMIKGEEIDLSHLIAVQIEEKSLSLQIKAKIEYEISGKKISFETDLPEIKAETAIKTSAFALYNSPEGDKLGLGPLPPIAGEPTNYWVFFETEAGGAISDFTLKAVLGEGVEFLNNYSLLAGDINYNQDKREIVWHIPGIVSGEDKYRLGMEIMFLPNEKQIASSPTIIKDIRYFAIDENTELEISGKLTNISTDIKHDILNPENGKVKTPSL